MTKRDFYLTLLSALLFSLSFPPSPLGFVAYFCLFPLVIALRGKNIFSAFKIGYLFGLISNSILLFWVGWATVPGAIAAIVLLCLYTAFLCWFYACMQKRWHDGALFFLPFLWVAMEYVRSLTEISFPWLNLSYTQTYYLPLIQHASIWGNYAVSFWIVWLNLLGYLWVQNIKRWKICLTLFAVLIILPYVYGLKVMSEPVKGEEIKIALLQGNIEQKIKWDEQFLDYNMQTYMEMSRKAAQERVDLIVWPESAAPCYLAAESLYFRQVQSMCDELRTPLLIGTNDYRSVPPDKLDYYNSAFLFTPQGGYPQVYNKIHLVPFSEKVPYEEKHHLSEKIQLGQSDFSSGTELTIFKIPSGKFATLICFESVYPELVRAFVNHGAQFLANITNDGWFGKTHGPYQHARIAIFRAIENRISIARCANTGISMFIDPFGRTSQVTKIFTRTIVADMIRVKSDGNSSPMKRTLYGRYGDWFAQICCLVSFFALFLALIRKTSALNRQTL
jgi:apolipoprotein N-acyltransferase